MTTKKALSTNYYRGAEPVVRKYKVSKRYEYIHNFIVNHTICFREIQFKNTGVYMAFIYFN